MLILYGSVPEKVGVCLEIQLMIELFEFNGCPNPYWSDLDSVDLDLSNFPCPKYPLNLHIQSPSKKKKKITLN